MKHFLFLISFIVALVTGPAEAAFKGPLDQAFLLNRGAPQAMQITQLGSVVTYKHSQVVKAQYDFSKQGGAIGAIKLLDVDGKPAVIPGKAVIKNVLIDVITAPTSGGLATIAIGSGQAANDLKAATAIASYSGIVAGIPVDTAASAIKITSAITGAGVNPSITVATAALTAGKFNVLIEYLVSD